MPDGITFQFAVQGLLCCIWLIKALLRVVFRSVCNLLYLQPLAQTLPKYRRLLLPAYEHSLLCVTYDPSMTLADAKNGYVYVTVI